MFFLAFVGYEGTLRYQRGLKNRLDTGIVYTLELVWTANGTVGDIGAQGVRSVGLQWRTESAQTTRDLLKAIM